MRKQCVHCGVKTASRPCGLCHSCFYHDPTIRERYRTESVYGRRGVGLERFRNHAEPVVANPGSEAKLQALEQRAAEGRPLFHPEDRFVEDVQ